MTVDEVMAELPALSPRASVIEMVAYATALGLEITVAEPEEPE